MKNVMKKWILGLATSQLIVPSATFAAPQVNEKPMTQYLAVATADTVNRMHTVGGFLKWISFRVPKAEIAKTEAYLKSIGVGPEQKIPTLKVEGSKVYFSKNDFMAYGKKSVLINGKQFFQQKAAFDQVVKGIFTDLTQKKDVAWYDFILPEANASISTGAAIGIGVGALLAGGALGYFAGKSFNDNSSGYTSYGQANYSPAPSYGYAGIGGLYAGQYAYNNYYTPSMNISCTPQQQYLVTNVGASTNGLPTSLPPYSAPIVNQPGTINGAYSSGLNPNQHIIPPGVVQGIYNGQNVPCTPQTAGYLSANLSAWPSTQFLSAPGINGIGIQGSINGQPMQSHPGTIVAPVSL